jgi:hypothetical protein
VKNKDVPLNNNIVGAATEMPNTVDILYFLGKNADKAKEIARLSPFQTALRIKEISDTLKSKHKTVSQAPDPLKPLKTQGGGITPMSDLPYPEYVKQRRKQQAERSG